MGGVLRVLVVDDDPLFARGLSRALEARGASVQLAHDLPTARQQLHNRQFDLIVLDYRLQDADGPMLLETWSGERALPPTIILSGYVGIRETVRTMRAGALDVLKKPASAEEILSRLTAPTGSDRKFSPMLIGDHPAIESARQAIQRLAKNNEPITLVGETGTGKSLLARLIHGSQSPHGPLVSIDCGAILDDMLEAELWGSCAAPGALSKASGGTLVLNELASLPRHHQQRLVQALTEKRFQSGDSTLPMAARVIGTSEHPLHELPQISATLQARFGATSVILPPLRERHTDIQRLANHFLELFATRHPGAPRRLTRSATATLSQHPWPGNVRELKGVIQHSAAICESPEIGANIVKSVLNNRTSPAHAGSGTRHSLSFRGSLPELERTTILNAFRASGNNVSEAARLVGLPRSTVRDKLKKYGIR